MRSVIQWFAEAMECKLKRNDFKPGWLEIDNSYLLKRLNQEVTELTLALEQNLPPEEIIQEAADVANFAMMIADKQLEHGKTKPGYRGK